MTPSNPVWLGPYYGSLMSLEDYEILTIKHIAATELKKETELMRKKWFDYRRLHPMQATYYLVECYKLGYKEFIRRNYDADYAEGIKKIFRVPAISKKDGKPLEKTKMSVEDFLLSREKKAFWQMRQMIDEFGMPYDFFIAQAIKWYSTEVFRQKCIMPPRPGQIMKNEEFLASAVLAWEEECENRIQYAKDPIYKTEFFSGRDFQIDYENFLITQINKRRHKRFALSAAIYEYRTLRIERALLEFDEDLINEAMREANSRTQ